jgi:integrase
MRGIFEKPPRSGVWWIRYADATGRIRREKVGTFEEAGARLRIRKEQAKLGVLPRLAWRKRPATLRKIAEDALAYADEYKRSGYSDHIRMKKLLQWFGERAAESISPQEIATRFESEKWSGATWNRYRALLSLAYRPAIRAGKIKENPARLVPHKAENNGRVRFLSGEEEKKLRRIIHDQFPEHEPELDVALHTGLRLSEQYGARWKDVDFERRVLTVPLDKGGNTSHVPLNPPALQALLELRRQRGDTEFVCGRTRSPRSWFEPAIEAAEIKAFTWHCLRHTFASRLVMSGADLRTVAELLRDKTLAMVMRYAHLAPDYKLAAVERMAQEFPDSQSSTRVAPTLDGEKPATVSVQ